MRGCAPVWAAREELTYARCLAGSRGAFIKGLDVRPKSKARKSNPDAKIKQLNLSTEPMYRDAGDILETDSDTFHDRCKEHIKRFMGQRTKPLKSMVKP